MRGTMGYCVSFFILICCLCSIDLVYGQTTPMVTIQNGTLEGSFLTSRKGREFESFRGIPYAQPPLGQLRFEPPQPFGSWTGVRSAKEDSNFCVQRNEAAATDVFIGGEDCLYLNVYRPKLPSNDKNRKYPVMIWIHGGGTTGSAHSGYYGPQYLLDHDIIFVSMNYRLGSLGFLSTGDLVSPGNQALKDQAQAIRWVHENIAAFNGDPNSVTLFGQSSGGIDVYLHMIHPYTRGFIHRAITESGDVLNPWVLNRQEIIKPRVMKLGQALKCPTGTSAELVSCLKTKNVNDLMATTCRNQVFDACPIEDFRPVIEPDHPGAYIRQQPWQSVKTGNIANIPWLTGITAQEGALKVAGIYGRTDKQYDKILDENFMTIAPTTFGYEFTCPANLQSSQTQRIRQFYFGNKKIDKSVKWNLIDLYTDTYFFTTSQIVVREHLKKLNAPVYYYYFDYRGTSSYSQVYGDPANNYGVAHADELQYLFPVYQLLWPNTPLGEEDNKVADVMTQLWTDFAKTGNPTPTKSPIPAKWTQVRTPGLQYLHIGNSTDIRMAENLLPERVNFWASLPCRPDNRINSNNHCSHK